MQSRNPFTSISNMSFVRNANNFGETRPASRSCSGGKNYFEYKGSYLKDDYLKNWQNRRNQQYLSKKYMGVEALRYQPQPVYQSKMPSFQTKGDYYDMQTLAGQPASLPLRSDFQQSGMKSSTRDMFGSDYFSNRYEKEEQKEQNIGRGLQSSQFLNAERSKGKKPSSFKPQVQANTGVSRFKLTDQSIKTDEEGKGNESEVEIMELDRQGCHEDPETVYIKSRRTVFFRYINPFEDEE